MKPAFLFPPAPRNDVLTATGRANAIRMRQAAGTAERRMETLVIGLRSAEGSIDPQAMTQLLSGLPKLSGNSMEDLRAFAARSLGVADDAITLRRTTEGVIDPAGAKGVSGAPVYLVLDREKNLLGVVKQFPDKKLADMGGELYAMHVLNRLGLRQSRSPYPIRSAALPDGGGTVLISPAQGRGIDDFIAQVGKARPGPERAAAMDELREAVRQNGVALAEFHTRPLGSGRTAATAIDDHIRAVQEITGKIRERLPDLDLWRSRQTLDADQLQARVDALVEGLRRNPGTASLVHGDYHPGNVFFDRQAGITFIDSGRLHESIGLNGWPTGAPARDYANFYQKLINFGPQYGLERTEILELTELFRQAYTSSGGAPLTAEAIQFFRARTALGEFLKAVNNGVTGDALLDQVRLLKQALDLQ